MLKKLKDCKCEDFYCSNCPLKGYDFCHNILFRKDLENLSLSQIKEECLRIYNNIPDEDLEKEIDTDED